MPGFAKLLALCLAASVLPAFGGEVERLGSAWHSVVLPAAEQIDLRSAATGGAYRLFVSVPSKPPPAQGYPVLYVLDGNAAFPVAAFLARIVAARREVDGQIPPVVVGIGYPGEADFDVAARRRDYTPGRVAGAPGSEGGADRFLDFLESEVKPLIASRHRIDRERQALFGHSFGGLFVLHALFNRPSAFSTYLASSPSIWYGDRIVLSSFAERAARATTARVQISVGSLEDDPPRGSPSPRSQASSVDRPMVSEARRLVARLKAIPGWQGRIVYHELVGEDHGPAWMPALTRGVRYFLEQPQGADHVSLVER